MTPNEKYYWELSEVYLAAYQDNTKPSMLSMLMMGVIVEMKSDVAKYLKNKGNNDKIKKQLNRIEILTECVDAFTVCANRNLQIERILTGFYDREKKLKNELEELKAKMKGIEKAWKAT